MVEAMESFTEVTNLNEATPFLFSLYHISVILGRLNQNQWVDGLV